MSEQVGETTGEVEGRVRAPSIPAAVFVREWQRSATLKDAVAVLGKNASLRAATLRKKGVNLKKFAGIGKGRAKLDITALNEIAANPE